MVAALAICSIRAAVMSPPMILANFAKASIHFWDDYLKTVDRAIRGGQVHTTVQDPVPSFPQSLLATELPGHFVMELVGGRTRHRGLRLLSNSMDSLDVYFGQFAHRPDTPAMFDFANSEYSGLKSLAVISPTTGEELRRRFPGVSTLYSSTLQWSGEPDVIPIRIGPRSNFICVEDCLLVNSFGPAVRIRNVQLAVVVRRDATETDLLNYFRTTFKLSDQISGMRMLPRGDAEIIQLAAQFANVYLMNGLRETSIGRFIDQHAEILTTALGCSGLISEPYLEWQVPSPDPNETAVNPDLFLIRGPDACDVYDLKLPLLNRAKITTGQRRRRRFVDSVEDGIAQLAHYREFLDVPENRTYAEAKYGVRFDTCRYGLVVGNYENVDAEEIREASRRLGDFTLVDYDTLLQLYVEASGINPVGQGSQSR